MTTRNMAALITDWDAARAELKALVRQHSAAAVAKRPPSGDWSALENVRHLLFAEQLHLGTLVQPEVKWSPLGWNDRTSKFPGLGTQPTKDIELVLREWDRVHRSIRRAVQGAGGNVAHRLERHVGHLRRHIVVVRRVLRRVGV